MKLVRIGLIPENLSATAFAAAANIERVVRECEMSDVERAADALAVLGAELHFVMIPDELWLKFLTAVRGRVKEVKMGYVLPVSESRLIVGLVPEFEFREITDILREAVETGCLVFQLPIEDEQ